VTKLITLIFINLVTPKARAKHELLFNEPASGLLNKRSCLAPALGVTKFTTIIAMLFHTSFSCSLSPAKIFNKPTSEFVNRVYDFQSSTQVGQLNVKKIISIAFGNWVTLYAGAKHEFLFNKSVVGLLNIQVRLK
jgi:hypothetical protein